MATANPPASMVTAMGRAATRGLGHGIGLAFAWLGMGLLWWRVFGVTGGGTLAFVGTFILGCLVLNVTVTSLWIEHNVRIHLAKGPRTEVSRTVVDYDHDWVGRHVAARWDDVRDAGEIVITVDAMRKRFVATEGAHAQRVA